jgi:hypothetical protein
MKKLLRLVVFELVLPASLNATVTCYVNLRSDPSTDNPPTVKPMPGTRLQSLEPDPTGGHFHVQTTGNPTGFV